MKSLLKVAVLMLFCISCMEKNKQQFDLQGHRGARGLVPENSIPAFTKAIELGVNTLEMDVVITRDNEVLVSHEPFMNAEFCLDTNGASIDQNRQMEYNLYRMTAQEIRSFDCGSKPHARFPEQKKMKVYKPLLSEVFAVAESLNPDIRYNIEIKSEQDWDNEFHPAPEVFSDLVFEAIDGKVAWDKITIQSFDFRILRYFRTQYPQVQLAALVENKRSIEENLTDLGFDPPIYSCDYVLLSRENVDQLHARNIRVVPWTVNEIPDMAKLIDWGVDGLITDYPDRYNQLINE